MSVKSGATFEELSQILAQASFLKPYAYAVQSCAPGECTVRVPYSPLHNRPGEIVNGIVIMGSADVAMWLAIMTLRGADEDWVTTDLKTAFLRSARAEDVFCTARVLKLGKKTAYGIAECRGSGTELLAHHVISYARVSG
jgi:uncharacterized protein (TIGR00369 family)